MKLPTWYTPTAMLMGGVRMLGVCSSQRVRNRQTAISRSTKRAYQICRRSMVRNPKQGRRIDKAGLCLFMMHDRMPRTTDERVVGPEYNKTTTTATVTATTPTIGSLPIVSALSIPPTTSRAQTRTKNGFATMIEHASSTLPVQRSSATAKAALAEVLF